MTSVSEIFDGAFYLENALSKEEQFLLFQIYSEMKEEFYTPKLKNGNSMNLQMNCLGKHWNAIDYKYYATRTDVDNKPVKTIPKDLISIARRLTYKLFPYHSPYWDICIINYYDNKSSLGIHRDNSESIQALDMGHPVVSFSIGVPAIFRVGGLVRQGESKDITLLGGDVFIFGGSSRMRYHGILGIDSSFVEEIPYAKELNGGRINFTLRKY